MILNAYEHFTNHSPKALSLSDRVLEVEHPYGLKTSYLPRYFLFYIKIWQTFYINLSLIKKNICLTAIYYIHYEHT